MGTTTGTPKVRPATPSAHAALHDRHPDERPDLKESNLHERPVPAGSPPLGRSPEDSKRLAPAPTELTNQPTPARIRKHGARPNPVLVPGHATSEEVPDRSCWIAVRGWCSSRAGRSRMSLTDLGIPTETLRKYVRRVEVDTGRREGLTQRGARGDQQAAQRELRAAPRERDLEGRFGVFRQGARHRPTEVTAFIEEHRGRFGVEPICSSLGVSASAYYQRAIGRALGALARGRAAARAHPRAARGQLLRLRLAADVEGAAARRRAGRSQPGRAADAPQRDPGREAARQAVADHDAGSAGPAPPGTWSSVTSRRRRRTGCGSATSRYLRCWEGVVYFSFIIDVFSRTVVGWQLAEQHAHDARARRAADGARTRARRAPTSR